MLNKFSIFINNIFAKIAHKIVYLTVHFLSNLIIILRLYKKHTNSVLHIGGMIHVIYNTVHILKDLGYKADYLSIYASNTTWAKSDYVFTETKGNKNALWKQFIFFWRVVAKYEVLHAHIMLSISDNGWELPYFKRTGGKIVVHYRGCEIRSREKNMALHPHINICQHCEHIPYICKNDFWLQRYQIIKNYIDYEIVTTPDMKDFVPHATHIPFFSPIKTLPVISHRLKEISQTSPFNVLHITNQRGIEGTDEIEKIIAELNENNYPITFRHISNLSNDKVLEAYKEADVTIGKMRMGYYANAQIESLFYGVPAITYIRAEFITKEMLNSGLIITNMSELKQTLINLVESPELLLEKKNLAQSTAVLLHSNEAIGKQYIKIYKELLI
jgi:glycosyltransferase involved in cell wall biosynthesis